MLSRNDVQGLFKKFDTNGDTNGVLSSSEFEAYVASTADNTQETT